MTRLSLESWNPKINKWQKAIGAEVKNWVNVNIPIWLEEHPDWFNAHAMSLIPEDFIDDPSLLARVRTRNVTQIIKARQTLLGGARATIFPPSLAKPTKRADVIAGDIEAGIPSE